MLLKARSDIVPRRKPTKWVRDHIHDFGGDPKKVTAVGVSAGSAGIHYYILTGSPLFDRAMLMSGSAPTLGPLPFEVYQKAWDNFLTRSKGFEYLKNPVARLKKARTLTPQEIISGSTSAPLGPTADGVLLLKEWAYNETQNPNHCKDIIISDTKVEAIMMDGIINSVPQQKFTDLAHASIKGGSILFEPSCLLYEIVHHMLTSVSIE